MPFVTRFLVIALIRVDFSLLNTLRTLLVRSMPPEWIPLAELISSGSVSLKRGQVIPKKDKSDKNIYPVYSSSVINNGLMGYNDTYMFDDELVSWSIDGGGDFFYREPHKFNITNVSGVILVDKKVWNYRFIAEILSYQHARLEFDYQSKAHPSVIQTLYSLPCISITQQCRFARAFELIDKQIYLQGNLQDSNYRLKQYLMQNLFI